MYTETQIIEIEPGFSIEVVKTDILPNVRLEVYKDDSAKYDATLIVGDNEIHFAWTDEAASLFDELDTCKPIELLTILAQAPNLLA